MLFYTEKVGGGSVPWPPGFDAPDVKKHMVNEKHFM